jgi:hypothetical protein
MDKVRPTEKESLNRTPEQLTFMGSLKTAKRKMQVVKHLIRTRRFIHERSSALGGEAPRYRHIRKAVLGHPAHLFPLPLNDAGREIAREIFLC